MGFKHRKTFIYQLKRHDKRYWMKFCGENKRNPINRLFNRLMTLSEKSQNWQLHSGFDTKTRFLLEQSHLIEAAKRSLPVPRVVMQGRGLFVTECAGQPLTESHTVSPKQRLTKAMRGLIAFHQQDMIHGRPAMRDILINDAGQVTYIDFEESRFSACQTLRTRDVLLLLLDSYRLPRVSQATRLALLTEWQQQVGQGSTHNLAVVARFLTYNRWMAKLVLTFKSNRLSRQLLLLERLLSRALR